MAKALTVSIASVAALLGAAGAQAAVAPHAVSPGPAPAALRQLVQASGGRANDAGSLRYAYLRKLDGHLQNVAAARLTGGDVAGTANAEGVTVTPRGSVSVDVYVNGDVGAATHGLRALGMHVRAVSDRAPQHVVEGLLPAGALTQAAALGATRAVLATFSGVNTGSVLSQGDAAHHGPQARLLGPTGAGVPVGIISDSINLVGGGIATSQGTGNLPASVQTLLDAPGGADEGRAMAEIVYDEAPGITSMTFSSGTLGAVTKASSIDNLVSAGVKVIADDTFDPTEPYFQDGVVAQAVDRARAADVAYFVSAGNRARQSWEGTYAPMADPRAVSPDTEDFDPAAGTDAVQTVGTIPNGKSVYVALQWDEPWGHATTNLAMDVYQISGGVPSYAFTVDSDNIATGIPEEFASVSASGGSVTFGIAIRRVAGTRMPFMKYIAGGSLSPAIEHPTNSDAIDPDAASARGALSVAASDFATPATPESFSSRGPVTRLFDVAGNRLATPDVRQKPEIAGADGVSTSVPGFAPFFGTSAAAPSVAGIAALIRSAKPALPVAGVDAILTNPANALACTASALGFDCGAGFALADAAVAQALDATPPVVAAVLAPGAPDGANGWYRSPVGVAWSVTDPGSPIYQQSGCDATTVTADGTTTLTCVAASAGGTTTVPLTIKHDASPPSAPTFTGIAARTYAAAKLPKRSAIHCKASDPASGVSRCVVRGYKATSGTHTLTATATNGAGLTSTRTLKYKALPALKALKLPRQISLGALLGNGISCTVQAVARSTRLVVTISALVPKPHGHGTRTIVVGKLVKTVGKGTARLHLTLSRGGAQALRHLAKVRLKVSVVGGVRGRASTTLGGSLNVHA